MSHYVENAASVIACLACGGHTQLVSYRREKKYPIYRCDKCRSFTADCPYAPQLYSENYHLISEDPSIDDPQMCHFAKVCARLLSPGCSVFRILDVGCGSGKFLHAYHRIDARAELFGVEINRFAVEKVQQRLPDARVVCGMDALPAQQPFDMVCAWNVIEHVPRPMEFVSALCSYTRTGGFVGISTPNYRQVNRWRKGIHKWESINPPYHLCIFSWQALHGFFQSLGLVQVHRSTFSWNFGGRLDWPRWYKPKYWPVCLLGWLGLGGNLLMIAQKR